MLHNIIMTYAGPKIFEWICILYQFLTIILGWQLKFSLMEDRGLLSFFTFNIMVADVLAMLGIWLTIVLASLSHNIPSFSTRGFTVFCSFSCQIGAQSWFGFLGLDINGLTQYCSNSIDNALELLEPCTQPLVRSIKYILQGYFNRTG